MRVKVRIIYSIYTKSATNNKYHFNIVSPCTQQYHSSSIWDTSHLVSLVFCRLYQLFSRLTVLLYPIVHLGLCIHCKLHFWWRSFCCLVLLISIKPCAGNHRKLVNIFITSFISTFSVLARRTHPSDSADWI